MIQPMLATLIDQPFDKEGWVFETKWDGYRVLAYKDKVIILHSRAKQTYTERFPSIVKELKKLPGHFIIDGEMVILDEKGRSHFQLLQNYQRTKEGTPYYYVFDILSLNGVDLHEKPFLERKKILKNLLKRAPHPHIRLSEHTEKNGKEFFKTALKKGLEGIIAKKADSPYRFKRSSDWLKIKTIMRQEVVIGGFTEPRGSRQYLGALLIGVYDKGHLLYAGHVGGGFNRKLLKEVHDELKKLETTKCPFSETPEANSPVTWVLPKKVCEVAFAEWTSDGKLRQAVFQGMRSDKNPKEVIRERPKHFGKS